MRLTDVHSGKLIWAEGYDIAAGELERSDLAVVRAIAEQIGQRLSN